MGLFPEDFYSNTQSAKVKNEIPLLKDYAIDLKTGEVLYDENNNEIIVEGLDAVIVQSWRKIYIPKFDVNNNEGYSIYGKNFGSQINKLIGKGKNYGETFAHQMLVECLVDNVYVTGINNISTKLEKSSYLINYTMETIYGNYQDSYYIPLD
ncbi:hypothetical protein B0P06_005260 [Clostridium saccharoperbutylacetonicum]|uniref:Uncharacterized protein n=1 Tax=Clostridium saccharoperbutylacetonicum N1-4(HMT) TaxID=931276 RepID=M1MP14_9CLOT|nr:DUF2634 domain-containing protein [Clostridium saccharoperbutylacetonicum]AGF56471.1 hypothetical protein DUF2634 [Clostridium saccharoperbutylacetonicum N1-4(HMT)]NRT62782.1 hypothetical protein [Clostridium saccharoperbutylacetonicum]NSB26135.1 hypothetical protein [Clostridium saccharoperbutylacetonicum]NSB45489.1 hypothetical protein [Clostridium saccharoperbutylacetonicum]